MADAICPHCGFDLETIQTITIGDWTAFRSGHIAWLDSILPFRPIEGQLVQAIMRSYPSPIRAVTLADRLSWSEASLYVYLSKVRRIMRLSGAPMMIARMPGKGEQSGYIWDEIPGPRTCSSK